MFDLEDWEWEQEVARHEAKAEAKREHDLNDDISSKEESVRMDAYESQLGWGREP